MEGERVSEAENDLYERDFYTWTQHQAELLRTGQAERADLFHIAEEIETLGRAEVSELRSRYKVLCLHLLKKLVQPSRDGRSWTTTIVDQRLEIAQLFKDNPGLKSKKDALFLEAYASARKLAASETHLPPHLFADQPPFSLEDAESETFWPGAENEG